MSIKNPLFTVRNNESDPASKKEMDFALPSFLGILAAKDVKASWLWAGEPVPNTVTRFVRDFDLDSVPEKATAMIAAESKYILWLNGRKIIAEGGLKRGFAPDGGYYDTVDIAPYLREGGNRLAVSVRFFGRDGFSHVSSGRGGFLFSCAAIGIESDASFKASRDEAFVAALDDDCLPNYRLPEGNLYYDARLDDGDFFKMTYNISGWQQAEVVCAAGDEPFGALYPRIIPQFKDFGISDYENSAEAAGKSFFSDRVLEMKLPYNCHVMPCLDIDAPAGRRIDIYTDKYSDKNGLSVRAVYITRKGRQSFECPAWMNGETVVYHIPKGVGVISLKYRETGYGAGFAGSFTCDDTVLNALYEKSRRTLYITMRDTFMDCPDRERSQWWGDAVNESEMCYYCMEPESALLIKKGILSMCAWQHKDGVMQTVVPARIAHFELPLQNLAGITGFWKYYLYTGDKSVLAPAYRLSVSYLSLWESEENGLVVHRSGSWDWPDWGIAADMPVLENAWYYYALTSAANMAKALSLSGDDVLTARAARLKAAFEHEFFDGTAFTSASGYDDRANAVAVCSRLADRDTYPGIAKVFGSVYNSSPYMEKYVLEALCRMGLASEARRRIKKRYSEMAKSDYSTLWEFWSADEGTKNHAWSGGPLIIMCEWLAGAAPLTPGWESYILSPESAGMSGFDASVPVPDGLIRLSARFAAAEDRYRAELPEGKTGIISVSCPEGAGISANGEALCLEIRSRAGGCTFLKYENGRAYLAAPAGKFEITVKKDKQNAED